MTTKYFCPCCGFDGLDGPAYADFGPPPWPDLDRPPYGNRLGFPSYDVCPCCGFEYGFDDEPGGSATPQSFEDYRLEWLAAGAGWFTPTRKPLNWNLREQLFAIGVETIRDFGSRCAWGTACPKTAKQWHG